MPGIGQEARDGKFAFVVVSMDTSETAGDPSNPYMQQTAQGVYVNLRILVTNIGTADRIIRWCGRFPSKNYLDNSTRRE